MASYQNDYPTLKNSASIQLQQAFAEGRWNTAISLASKQFKQSKDPYFQAVEAAAKSKGDSLEDKAAVIAAVDAAVKDPKAVLDVDTLELYEWACEDENVTYSKTLGVLRCRLVKANPKNTSLSKRCFEACLDHQDRMNAQQICATLNRANPSNKELLWLNIYSTHTYSKSPQCPENQRQLFSQLVYRQVIKETEDPNAVLKQRDMVTAFRVLNDQMKADDVIKTINHPGSGAVACFKKGDEQFLKEGLSWLVLNHRWNEVFTLCKAVLTYIPHGEEHPSLAGCNWSIWKLFLDAARKIETSDDKSSLETVEAACKLHLAPNRVLEPVHRRTLRLVKVILALARTEVGHDHFEDGASPAAKAVYRFIGDNYDDPSCFDDIKPCFEQLIFEDANWVLRMLDARSERNSDQLQRVMLCALRLRLRYVLATSPKNMTIHGDQTRKDKVLSANCNFCSRSCSVDYCYSCLFSIVNAALDAYSLAIHDGLLRQGHMVESEVNPLTDIVIIGFTCLLRVSKLSADGSLPQPSKLYKVDTQRLLQAFVWLDQHLSNYAPSHVPGRMIQMKVYLLFGGVSEAQRIWPHFGVKNVTVDTLGSYMYDRIGSMNPGIFSGSPGRRNVLSEYTKFYFNADKSSGPKVLKNAIRNGNYDSALDMTVYLDRLSHSCARIMTAVEQRRGIRAMSGKNDRSLAEEFSLGPIPNDTEIFDNSDNGSVPNHEITGKAAFVDYISAQPRPSSIRSHLQLNGEMFLDKLLFPASPKEHKPVKAAHSIQGNAEEMMQEMIAINLAISYNLHKDYKNEARTPVLTSSEASYYGILEQLSSLIPNFIGSANDNTLSEDVKATTQSIKETLNSQRETLTLSAKDIDKVSTLLYMSSLHALGMLRESALAVKLTVNYLLTQADKSSGGAAVPKALTKDLQELAKAANEAQKTVKDRIHTMKSALLESGWIDRVATWAFGDIPSNPDADGPFGDELGKKLHHLVSQANVEAWASRLVDSWRDVVKDLSLIKFD